MHSINAVVSTIIMCCKIIRHKQTLSDINQVILSIVNYVKNYKATCFGDLNTFLH